MELVLGSSSAAGSTCSKAGRRLPCHSTPPFPSPADYPTFPRHPLGGCFEAPPDLQLGPGKRRQAPQPRPRGGGLVGVLSLSLQAVGSRSGYRRGVRLPSLRARASRKILRRGPLRTDGGCGWPAGGSSEKCVRARLESAAAPGAAGAGTDGADHPPLWSSRGRAWRAAAWGNGVTGTRGGTGRAPSVS